MHFLALLRKSKECDGTSVLADRTTLGYNGQLTMDAHYFQVLPHFQPQTRTALTYFVPMRPW